MDIIMRDIIEENMGELVSLLQRIMKTDYVDKVIESAECLLCAMQTDHKILIAGNGGSAADAQHMADSGVGTERRCVYRDFYQR